MNFSSIWSDIIAGVVSALVISIPSYLFAVKSVTKQINNLNKRVINSKEQFLDTLGKDYQYRSEYLLNLIDSVNLEIRNHNDRNYINGKFMGDENRYIVFEGEIEQYKEEIEIYFQKLDENSESYLRKLNNYYSNNHQ